MKGIDVSKHNGNIDWGTVKTSGVDFAIIRAGYGRLTTQKDIKFEANYKGAKAAGIPVGAYWYSYAQNTAEAILEAKACLEVIKGKKFDFPIYFDIEESSQVKLGKAVCTKIVQAFCQELENAGYFVGVYSFNSFFQTNLEDEIRKRYATWIARTPKNDDGKTIVAPSYNCGIHQYSFKGKINGISGDVDLNKCDTNYPELIRRKKLNGYESYRVTAEKSNLSDSDASEIKKKCEALGMTVKIE